MVSAVDRDNLMNMLVYFC